MRHDLHFGGLAHVSACAHHMGFSTSKITTRNKRLRRQGPRARRHK